MEIINNAWLFQNATATGDGTTFVPGRNDQITIFITGDSSSRTIHFEGSDNEGNWFPVPAVKLPELTIASSTTGNDEVWTINISNWVYIRTRISAIEGGTVKITGRIVDSGINLLKSVSSLPTGSNVIGKVGLQTGGNDIDESNPLAVNMVNGGSVVTGSAIGTDQVATYANSAAANTQVNVDFVKPDIVKSRYIITVYNPSTVSDLTIKMFSTCLTLASATRYGFLDSFTVPKSQAVTGTTINTYSKIIEGCFIATDLRLVVSNNTVLGGSDGFSAYIRIREVV